ncbi:hypothetical protein M988_2609 [Hafnia paralvei ATCC 29927]|nr:hypothetical protein M988_2609 [Hafnia paralvei ATCC 29927]
MPKRSDDVLKCAWNNIGVFRLSLVRKFFRSPTRYHPPFLTIYQK